MSSFCSVITTQGEEEHTADPAISQRMSHLVSSIYGRGVEDFLVMIIN